MNTDVEMPLSDTNYHGRGKDQVTEKDDIFLKNSLTLRLQAYGVVLGGEDNQSPPTLFYPIL